MRCPGAAQDEHRRLAAELASAKEQLRTCRAEGARRQKALAVLQALAVPPHASSAATSSSAGPSLAPGGALPLPPGAPSAFPLPPELPASLLLPRRPAREGTGGEDPLPAALEAAAASARAATAALEGERGARAAAEARLREAKTALERKAAAAMWGGLGGAGACAELREDACLWLESMSL